MRESAADPHLLYRATKSHLRRSTKTVWHDRHSASPESHRTEISTRYRGKKRYSCYCCTFQTHTFHRSGADVQGHTHGFSTMVDQPASDQDPGYTAIHQDVWTTATTSTRESTQPMERASHPDMEVRLSQIMRFQCDLATSPQSQLS